MLFANVIPMALAIALFGCPDLPDRENWAFTVFPVFLPSHQQNGIAEWRIIQNWTDTGFFCGTAEIRHNPRISQELARPLMPLYLSASTPLLGQVGSFMLI